MQTWQIVIAVVAVALVGWMSLALARLFSRRAPGKAIVRMIPIIRQAREKDAQGVEYIMQALAQSPKL